MKKYDITNFGVIIPAGICQNKSNKKMKAILGNSFIFLIPYKLYKIETEATVFGSGELISWK